MLSKPVRIIILITTFIIMFVIGGALSGETGFRGFLPLSMAVVAIVWGILFPFGRKHPADNKNEGKTIQYFENTLEADSKIPDFSIVKYKKNPFSSYREYIIIFENGRECSIFQSKSTGEWSFKPSNHGSVKYIYLDRNFCIKAAHSFYTTGIISEDGLISTLH